MTNREKALEMVVKKFLEVTRHYHGLEQLEDAAQAALDIPAPGLTDPLVIEEVGALAAVRLAWNTALNTAAEELDDARRECRYGPAKEHSHALLEAARAVRAIKVKS